MYDKQFYDVSRKGMIESAAVLAPQLAFHLGMTKDSTLLDVGCGEGHWASEFGRGVGCTVRGIDSSGAKVVPGVPFIDHDLRTPFPDGVGVFDFVLCLEVAEHLPESRAESFVEELCDHADKAVIFSAAIPGQGGTGHINEQWPGYWAALFDQFGYWTTGAMRYEIWEDDRIENWYRQNLLVAVPKSQVWKLGLFETDHGVGVRDCPPLPLVHPVLYDARRR